jgi:hypothetical protein
VTQTHQPEGLTFAPEYDQPVRYIERTRSWYQALGYPNVYQWAHYLEVPFAPLSKLLAESCVTFVTTYFPQMSGMITREFRPGYSARKVRSGTPSRSRV